MTKNPYPSRHDLMTAAATLAAVGPAHGLTAKDQAAAAPAREASQEMVKGVVFETRTGGQRQADDRGLAGVLVSNGREVVRTGPDGGYSLPIEDGMSVFVIKPTGYAVPLDATTRLPRFSFIHQPHGTPAGLDLRYPGLPPTGSLPESVDFGLIKTEEPKRFDVVLFADPQPESHTEIDFIRDDVVNGLIGVDAAFGMRRETSCSTTFRFTAGTTGSLGRLGSLGGISAATMI